MIPVEIKKISYHPSSRNYAVILNEIGGDRCLPVIVGSFEAQSIALAIEVADTPRPLTHDLICNIINKIRCQLKTVKISNISNGIFYATMEIYSERLGKINVDARPSDAIAVAIRLRSPIFVSEDVMASQSVAKLDIINQNNSAKKEQLLLKNLKERLEEAIKKEEYEVAAEIRDQIIKIES
tara:strand:+ start:492 stop:1037 length:546 start_codon:yes stop_codon:yes gene_type:complete